MVTLLLLACAGPSDVTVIRDVQIVHIGAEPPEAAPGEVFAHTVTVADPSGGGVEAMAWPCTDLGEGCVEDPGAAAGWAQALAFDGEDARFQGVISPLWATVLADPELSGFSLSQTSWVLACRPGLCPVIGQALAGDDQSYAFLQDPVSGMASLPLDGASLSRRGVVPSLLAEEERNRSPSLGLDGEVAFALGVGEELSFSLLAEDPDGDELTVDVFTTLGSLGPARVETSPAEFTWYAGETSGEGRLYATVRDGRGGSALWSVDVRAD